MKLLVMMLFFLLPHAALGSSDSLIAEQCVQRYSAKYGVPPELVASLIDVESGWNPRAISTKGAMGLMQLMPATARRFGAFEPYDIDQNIAAGTRYLTTLMWEFRGDMRLVAAAYYAGDYWIGQKQLSYRNPDVVAYVQAVRSRYMLRKFGARLSTRR